MESIIVNEEKLRFTHLPGYAAFLLNEKLEEYVSLSFEISREEELPLLVALSKFSDDELTAIGIQSSTELLSALAEGRISDQIRENTRNFLSNSLEIVDQDEIVAEDITLVAFIRRKALSCFLPDYTDDTELKKELLREIDTYTTQEEIVAYNAYMRIQRERLQRSKDRLEFQESLLLEAQEISEMGSFFIDYLDQDNSNISPQIAVITGLPNFASSTEFFQRVHPDDLEIAQKAWEHAFTNGGNYDYIIRYTVDGREKRLHSKGRILVKDGRAINSRGTLRDITKEYTMITKLQDSEARQKQLNLSLSKKNSELVNINRELESFNYVASHDLQEPLRKIQIYSGRLMEQDNSLSAEAKESLSKVITSASRMQRLIADLIEFSQISSTREALEHVDLNEVVGEIEGMHSDQTEAGTASFEVGFLPTVNAVAFQMSQLFSNIIGNALKYKRPDTPARVTVTSAVVSENSISGLESGPDTRNFIRISICDNGIGFEEEQKDNIFDLFKRLHSKDLYSGTGIGLAICKKIVHQHDGYIRAESRQGSGSCFHIYLPESRVLSA